MRWLMSLFDIKVPFYMVISVVVLMGFFALASATIAVYTDRGGNKAGVVGDAMLDVSETLIETTSAVLTAAETARLGHHPMVAAAVQPPPTDGYRNVADATSFGVEGPYVFASEAAMPGWRVISGTFTIAGEAAHAALLLDDQLDIRHVWPLDETRIDSPDRQAPMFKFPHGFVLLRDGSVVFAFDNGVSLQRVDACGQPVWSRSGQYHHAITYRADTHTLWTLRYTGHDPAEQWVVEVDADDGSVVREFTLQDVIAANPNLDVLGVRKIDGAGGENGAWADDPFHINDVDPLPAELAASFPDFVPGDLLLSLRSLNLIVAVDPETQQIRWHRSGFVSRQHDPDWLPDGRILVYDNRMFAEHSRIVTIDPASFVVETIVDGAPHDFFSNIRGKSQMLPNGSVLLVSSQQGRVIEVTPAGEIAFDFLNHMPDGEAQGFTLSEALWLPEGEIDIATLEACRPTTASGPA